METSICFIYTQMKYNNAWYVASNVHQHKEMYIIKAFECYMERFDTIEVHRHLLHSENTFVIKESNVMYIYSKIIYDSNECKWCNFTEKSYIMYFNAIWWVVVLAYFSSIGNYLLIAVTIHLVTI